MSLFANLIWSLPFLLPFAAAICYWHRTRYSDVFTFRESVRRFALDFLSLTHKKFPPTNTLRQKLFDTPIRPYKPANNHTHGDAAAERSAARNFMDLVCAEAGYEQLCYNAARADIEEGRRDVIISHHWVKDMDKPVVKGCVFGHDRTVITMVDVDYYVEMPTFLARNQHSPVMLYTFVPSAASAARKNYSYTFDAYGNVQYTVSGGGMYSHCLWDYAGDSLIATESVCGLPMRSTFYYVERRNIGIDHQVVLLVPSGHYKHPLSSAVAQFVYKGRRLTKFNPIHGRFIRIRYVSAEGDYTSTGVVGAIGSATLRTEDDCGLKEYVWSLKTQLTNSTVRGFTVKGTEKLKAAEAAILVNWCESRDYKPTRVVFPVEFASIPYQLDTTTFVEPYKPLMTAYSSPWYHRGYSPYDNAENEDAGYVGRVIEVRSDVVASKFVQKAIYEFATLLIPEAHTLEPLMREEVHERQPRPSQQVILRKADVGVIGRLSMFLKREAYMDPKDPRVITQDSNVHKAEYSAYIYALSDVIKEQPWYAFGHSPASIADRVVEVCSEEDYILATDFSRFDGHVSPALRLLERVVLQRAFATQYTEEITELHRQGTTGRVYGRYDNEYDSGTERKSGSPETSLMNTLASAFVAFLAMRSVKTENGNFVDATTAWNWLGVYGGDDGFSRRTTVALMVKAAQLVGQKLTVQRVDRGDYGVTFLSRVYGPNVWTGDRSSMCDVPRHLAKLHLSVGKVDPSTKILEKARGFIMTDANTPFIGVWAQVGLSLGEREGKIDGSWFARTYSPDVQFPNDGDWFWSYADEHWQELNLRLGEQYLREQPRNILSPILLAEPTVPKVTVPTIVQGLVHEPEQIEVVVEQPSEPQQKSKKKTRRGNRGGAKARP